MNEIIIKSNRYKIKDVIYSNNHGSEYIVGDIAGNNYYIKTSELNDAILGTEVNISIRYIDNDYSNIDDLGERADLIRDFINFLISGEE